MVKYTAEFLTPIVQQATSYYDVLRLLGLKYGGGTYAYLKKKITTLGIDTSHFKGKSWNSGRGHVGGAERLAWQDVLVNDRFNGEHKEDVNRLRRAMKESGIEEICAECGSNTTWNNLPLRLQIDHRDGNKLNNLQTNVRFLCPNCHSQTENWGAGNIQSEKKADKKSRRK